MPEGSPSIRLPGEVWTFQVRIRSDQNLFADRNVHLPPDLDLFFFLFFYLFINKAI
jgi:hypothetical protein